jgi:hypothetical protein
MSVEPRRGQALETVVPLRRCLRQLAQRVLQQFRHDFHTVPGAQHQSCDCMPEVVPPSDPEARRGRVDDGGVVPAAQDYRADLLPLESKRQRNHTVDGLWLSPLPAPIRCGGLRASNKPQRAGGLYISAVHRRRFSVVVSCGSLFSGVDDGARRSENDSDSFRLRYL